jgi:hypothetical protein
VTDAASRDVAAVQTVGAVLTDLVEVAEQLPVPAEQAEQTARILDRLAEEITEAATILRGWPVTRTDGSVPAGDVRVTRARALIAERHEPLTMTPGDLRTLLACFQRRMTGLLEVIDGPAASQ